MENQTNFDREARISQETPSDVYRETMRKEIEGMQGLIASFKYWNSDLATKMRGPSIEDYSVADVCNEGCGKGSYTWTMDRIVTEMQQLRKGLAQEVDALGLNLSSL